MVVVTCASEKEFLVVAIVEQLAASLQELFTTVSDEAARASACVQRVRRLTGARLVQGLVFQWLASPQATVDELATALGITPQAVQQRFTDRTADCLRRVLEAAVARGLAGRQVNVPLLRRFSGVYAEDGTTFALPAALAELFPGCGGSRAPEASTAAVKMYLCYALASGAVQHLALVSGRTPDVAAAATVAPALPAGALRIADLGFFDRARLARDTAAGVYWLSRLPVGVTVATDTSSAQEVSQFLAQQPAEVRVLDQQVRVGQAQQGKVPLPCRLLAFRCPPEVAARRRQKVKETARRKGRTVSARQLVLCDWVVLITNVPEELLSVAEAWELYRARWQIEWLFKRWKGLGGLHLNLRWQPQRVLCEFYAKLLGMLVAQWGTLIRGGPLEGVSLVRALRRVRQVLGRLAEALRRGESPQAVLEELAGLLDRLPRQPRRRTRPSTRQRLFQPRLGA